MVTIRLCNSLKIQNNKHLFGFWVYVLAIWAELAKQLWSQNSLTNLVIV